MLKRTETVPIEFEQCRKTGRIDAWKLDWREGMQPKPHPFWDLDVANNGSRLDDLILPRDAKLAASFDAELLGGVTTITDRARRIDRSAWKNALYRPARHETKAARCKAVPYCVWNNRKAGEMLVWIRAGS